MLVFSPLRRFLINRSTTSAVSYLIDNFLPVFIRDSKWFMRFFFRMAYKSRDVEQYMEFKSEMYTLTSDRLKSYYENYNSIGTERQTDLSEKSIHYILSSIDSEVKSVLDVGCGKGYFAALAADRGFDVTASDFVSYTNNCIDADKIKFVRSNLERLSFSDNAYDVVTCHHTLEHILSIREAVTELKRVARRQVIVTVPCQRFFYYTVDLHLHFFPKKEMLVNLMDLSDYSIKKVRGDWVYVGYL